MTARNPRSRERGIALLSVVAVLVLLAIIATPFLVTMRDGAQRGKAVLAEAQAAKEAETAFRVAAAYLTGTHDASERWAKDSGVKDQPDTPDWDTLPEFQIHESVLRNAGLDPENGRIWGVTIEDESAKINVNSAPFTLLGRFFGSTRLLEPADEAATDLNLESDGGLPARDGVVRLGDEVVHYERREGSVLRGCKRGYKQDTAGNGPPRKHGAKALVVNEIAFQVSAYPILARRGKFDGVDRVEYAPYQNLYEMRRISDLGVAALSADEFDRVADHLTVASRGIAGHVWGDPQNLRDPITAGEDGHKARLRLDNPQRYGIGTIVRISDGTNTDYGVVFSYGGQAQVEVVPATLHDYDANTTRVEAIIRHPVNVNTASVQVLTALFAGICRHTQDPIDADTARSVAERLVKVRTNEQQPAIRSLKDLKDILREAVRANALRVEEATALELNALNPMETAANRLAVGSMPMGFKSGEVFTITARAAVLDRSGQESGRRSFRRVVDVNPQGTAVLEIAGQYDLDEMLRVSNSKYMTTYPLNVGSEDRGTASPPSRFTPFFKSDRWPSRDRNDEAASVRMLPSRLEYGTGRQAFPAPEHFDDTNDAEGHALSEGSVSFSSKDGRVSVSSEDGLEPFAASLWFKPQGGSGQTTFILDGGKQEWEDRVGLFMDGERRELVLRVKDTSRQDIAAELRYPFDKSTWAEDTWYHLHISVLGSRPDQMSMTVDGVGRGKPTLMTWTSTNVDPTGEVTALGVEDASSFPERGALLLRGPDGVEVMEYSARSDNSFTIRKRFARFNRADTVDAPNDAGTSRSFPAGSCVSLYGYSIPTASRIPEGNGSLASALGKMNVLVLDSQNPPEGWPNASGGGGDPTNPGGGGGGGGGPSGILKGWRGDRFSLNLGSDVHGWDGADGVTAAKAFGSRGLAVLASGDGGGGFYAMNAGVPEFVQDAELVEYTVSGGTMEIIRKPEPTKYLTYNGSTPGTSAPSADGTVTFAVTVDKKTSNANLPFVPQHTYGNPDTGATQYTQYYAQRFGGARPYGDTDRIVEDGLISVLIPLSVDVTGSLENFLDLDADQARTPETGFIQIGTGPDTEWIRYNDIVQRQGVLAFVRDRSLQRVLYLFRNGTSQYVNTGTLDDPTNPDPTPDPNPDPDDDEPPAPPPPEDDGGGGGGPDAPPVPDPGPGGEDDGPPDGTPDTPPLPPDPGPGEDDGPGDGGPDTPPEPGPGDPGEDDGPGDGGPDTPPEPGPDDPGEDDGPGDGDPDTPPDPTPDPTPEPEPEPEPTPEDPGDTDSPPDPTTPGGPTTGGGSGTVKVPFPLNEIARYLDFRSTFEDNTGDEYEPTYVGDLANSNLQNNGHASGAQVLPCFLVAFPGVEYDPQGDGTAVEYDYDSILTSGSGTTGGGAPTTGGSGGSGSIPQPPKTTSSNGSAAAGDTGDDGETGSADLIGRWIEPGPGEDDEVTLVAPGEDGARESHVVNWSHRRLDWNRTKTFRRTWTWAAFQQPVAQTFDWSSDRLTATTAGGMATDAVNYSLGRLGDPRKFVRLLKSPSGELPVRVPGSFHIGADYNGASTASAMVDEVRFASPRTTDLVVRRGWYLGSSPVAGGQGVSITAEATNMPIHIAPGYAPQTNAAGIRTSGGLLRVGDELIGYSEFDTGTQTFTGLERGAMGTEARVHSFGVSVTPVHGIAVSRLSEAMQSSSSKIPLANHGGFPIYGGFVRIGREVLGYTRIGANGVLEMPESRSIRKDSNSYAANAGADTDAGSGLFRARYGTESSSHDAGALVYHLDNRYPDFVREKADHPQMSWYTVSRESRGAVWKRVSWDARLRSLNGLRVIVRFEGGPAWDSDKMIRVGTDAIPDSDRSRWLYEISDPHKENLLNVQSDRIECRVLFNYEKGAFDPEATTSPDAWKDTPWLKAFRIEYVAPASVVTTEDLR